MLTKKILKRFSKKIYTVGWNYNNLGRTLDVEQQLEDFITPTLLNFDQQVDPKKIVMGFSETLILTNEGSLYNFGTNAIFNDIDQTPQKMTGIEGRVLDMDVDFTHSIYLTEDNRVLEMNKEEIKEIKLEGKVEHVACGKNFSMAVVGNEAGKQKLFVWQFNDSKPEQYNIYDEKGNVKENEQDYMKYLDSYKQQHARKFQSYGRLKVNPNVFCVEGNEETMEEIMLPEGVTEIKGLSDLIAMDNTKIKKLKVVDESIAVLLENGVLATWGNNETGNLGIPRSLMVLYDVHVSDVKVPMLENGLNEFVKDFDISENNIIMLTEKNELYYSGRDKHLSLRKLDFFKDQKIKSVGSFFNNYVIVTEEGRVYATEELKGEEYVKWWGDYKLYEYNRAYFGEDKVVEVSGKYGNAYLLAE